HVKVPDVVMNQLVKPLHLAGVGVDCDQRSGIEILAFGAGAIRVTETGEDQAARLVYGHRRPHVGAAAILEVGGWPRSEVRLSGLRNDVELPHLLAGNGVPRANVAAGLRWTQLTGGATCDDQVLVNEDWI